ncbi:MAG TPA: sulfatase [Alphaproteobacteria bacterium]|nr:sulfatase [Alphaproteobacteria bacterium]
MGWRFWIVAVVLLIAAGLGARWYLTTQNPLLLVRMIVWFQPKPKPNIPVTWQQGPAAPEKPAGERAPNIIVIVADDLGYNDISLHGGVAKGAVRTPNIDALGSDGVILKRGYSGNATCSPSRAAMMTGRFATRFGFEYTPAPKTFARNIAGYVNSRPGLPSIYHAEREGDVLPPEQLGVPSTEVMLPELLKQANYHSVMLGKWHLGDAKGMTPFERGFNEALAFMPGAAMFLPEKHPDVVNSKQDFDPIDQFLWVALPFQINYNNGPNFMPDKYMTDYLGDEAVKAIEANRNRPFFMYLAFNAPHTPLQALKSDYDALSGIEDHRLRVYGAMIKALDRNVGKVMDALKAQGLDENTLVVFTSDNGGAHYVGLPEINAPYRGWKATFFEGGIRVPYFMRWPAKLPKGATFEVPAGHVDIFATAAAAAGVPLPDGRTIDGVDLSQFVTGAAAPDTLDRPLFWRSGGYKVLLHRGWKLQVSERQGKTWLFNVEADPFEKTNVAETETAKAAEMMAKLTEIDSAQAKPLWPSLIESPVPIDHPRVDGVSEKDEHIYWSN